MLSLKFYQLQARVRLSRDTGLNEYSPLIIESENVMNQQQSAQLSPRVPLFRRWQFVIFILVALPNTLLGGISLFISILGDPKYMFSEGPGGYGLLTFIYFFFCMICTPLSVIVATCINVCLDCCAAGYCCGYCCPTACGPARGTEEIAPSTAPTPRMTLTTPPSAMHAHGDGAGATDTDSSAV